MQWNTLLRTERLNDPDYRQEKHRPAYMQDMDRILFSPPFRRLANKTQVHPLYDNDHVHHRLIHSLEAATVGHSLGTEVGSWLADDLKALTADQVKVVAGLVQTACMAHDIGNPPFGHSGEEAIGSWFKEKFAADRDIMGDIPPAQRVEFNAFEGNAQGFRILTRTEMYRNRGGMRLALGSLGAFTKYPVSAPVRLEAGAEGVVEGTPYIGLKKYGFFENDVPTFAHVATELGLRRTDVRDGSGQVIGSWWRRHPLAFLMEAADDICYNIMDLEDAFLSEDISFEVATRLLGALTTRSGKEYPERSRADIVSIYRAKAISGAIAACVDAFRENYAAIMDGTFPRSLVEASRLGVEFQDIRQVSRTEIFNAARKTELEVYGRNVVYRILDGLLPLFNELRAVEWDCTRLSAYHAQLVRALRLPVAHVTNAYDALHALTDFVSGMTDRYAVKVADMIGRR